MERRITEEPERWSLIRLENKDEEVFYKVFASWAGGYLDGDRWKMNSGIASVDDDDDFYYFNGASGSCYKCHKGTYGVMTSYSRGVLENILGNAYKVDIKAKLLEENEIETFLTEVNERK